ncbi:MAG TPA: hypothetical protein DCY56_06735 [Candidatus Omnitrophica bacterium]|nr:hypothetical protein [Candidatus Omnitrophota bacterium]
MDKCLPCQKCHKPTSYIRHGKFALKTGRHVQRIRCKNCGKTSIISYSPFFFDRMHTDPEKFNKAMSLYKEGYSIKSIALQLKMRPNTVIDWIKKVKQYKYLYISYLKKYRSYNYRQVAEFFKDFSRLAKIKRTKQLKQYRKNRPVEPSSSFAPS